MRSRMRSHQTLPQDISVLLGVHQEQASEDNSTDMSTEEPTKSPEDHRLVSAEASPTDSENMRVVFRREPIPTSSCAKMRLKLGQRNPASFAAKKKTPDERSFAMDLVVPCALLAHELGEQHDGYMPTERDRAVTAQDPTQHNACAKYETAFTARIA